MTRNELYLRAIRRWKIHHKSIEAKRAPEVFDALISQGLVIIVEGFYLINITLTYTPMNYFASVPVKGGKNALVERDSDNKFQLTKLAREWLYDNLANLTDCEYWQYGDTAQLAFKFDADRLNFVKWMSWHKEKEQRKKKGKKNG